MNPEIEKLKHEKSIRGISNEKLAYETGLNVATIGKIFCGIIKNPRVKTIDKIKQAIKH